MPSAPPWRRRTGRLPTDKQFTAGTPAVNLFYSDSSGLLRMGLSVTGSM